MQRIGWLDSSRGLAILMIILIHYVGALETRDFISEAMMLGIKSVLRVATPFFILIFGFTFFTFFSRKVENITAVVSLYKKLAIKILYIFLAREFIVLISSFRYEQASEHLIDILLYRETSGSGEILTFYMFALMVSPLVLYLVKSINPLWLLCIAVAVYSFGYGIGSHFEHLREATFFRLFFYDVYPFFPFYGLVLLGFFFSRMYSFWSVDRQRVLFFLSVSVFSILCAFLILMQTSDNVLRELANAELKSPPTASYMLLYVGLVIIIVSINAYMTKRNYVPLWIGNVLNTIGRNSLLAYTLHYTLFLSSFIMQFAFGHTNKTLEITAFIIMMLCLYSLLVFAERPSSRNK
jgi:surface polysaccharide O-acyltransferase-like enzyme